MIFVILIVIFHQVKARQHANIITTQKALLKMWKKDSESKQNVEKGKASCAEQAEFVDDSTNLDKLVMYIDRMRYRKPGTGSKLTPHMDSGSITRWSDPIYRYKKYFSRQLSFVRILFNRISQAFCKLVLIIFSLQKCIQQNLFWTLGRLQSFCSWRQRNMQYG